ncbi:MAG: hypothetical protein RI911_528 [Candidatus Parcubacteria bacterium]|jgi:uncharacterized membrane protein
MGFLAFLISIYALVVAHKASKRNLEIEQYLQQLHAYNQSEQNKSAPSSQAVQQNQSQGMPSAAGQLLSPGVQPNDSGVRGAIAYVSQGVQTTPVTSQTISATQTQGRGIGEWLKEDWLLKVGALLLLLSFGWFVSYAIANNWIGPVGRIGLGMLAGISLMVVGFLRYKAIPNQADIFLVLGAVITILTVFAARALYGFFTPLSALALMCAISGFIALASILYNRRPLATISLFAIGVAPFLTASPNADVLGLFMYFGVLLIAAAVLSSLRDYPELNSTAAGFLWVYSLIAVSDFQTRDTAFLIACFYMLALFGMQLYTSLKTNGLRKVDVFAMLMNSGLALMWVSTIFTRDTYLMPVLLWALVFIGGTYIFFVLRTKSFRAAPGEYQGEPFTAFAHGVMFLLACMGMIAPALQSLVLVSMAALFCVLAYGAFLMTEKREGFYLYAAMAIIYIGVATAVELQGNALTIAYALQASAITLLAFAFTKDIASARQASVLFVIPVFLSFLTIGNPFSNSALAVLTIMGSILIATGLYFRSLSLATNSETNRQWYATLIVVGACYFLITIWRACTEMFFYGSFGVMVALILYTFLGIGAYILGTQRDIKVYRVSGTLLVCFVIARLLLVDIWALPSEIRIVTFMVIGALMVSTAFILRKRT